MADSDINRESILPAQFGDVFAHQVRQMFAPSPPLPLKVKKQVQTSSLQIRRSAGLDVALAEQIARARLDRVRAADVARVARVSPALVCKIFGAGSDEQISAISRRLVLEAAELIGYVPPARK